tara:strand:- start:1070 stop:1450 length:381 start_codon:yes stop_codon:yes gene_type:complete
MAKKFNIIIPKPASDDAFGTTTRLYQAGEQVEAKEDWQKDLMETFMANGWAEEIKVDEPTETKEEEVKPVRARKEDGTLKGDDPTTPDVNEAWEGGEAPKKKAKKKKAPAKKKATTKKKTATKAKS